MEVSEKAPAKINLGLDALSRRIDGYHELKMVMASVDLSDQLSFQNRTKDSKICLSTDNGFLPLDKRNHIYQAAEILQTKFNVTSGVTISLKKRIPVSAGLAGGSSDAAATLRGLNRLWNLNLTMEELADIGSQVGSDVPYCIYGNTSLVTGRGEVVMPLPIMPQCWVILVKPPISVSTSTIFNNLSLDTVNHPDIEGIERSIEDNDYYAMTQKLGNVLESVTISRYPIVAQIKQKMMQFGADAALMSGSGPTVFALCMHESRARRICNGLKGFCDEVYLVRTLNK